MYSFGPLPKQGKSGRHLGTHQKINRVARKHLNTLFDHPIDFPRIPEILHFEGSRGPDGVKLKSPGRDEPWHFIDPAKPHDGQLLESIHDHINNLSVALATRDNERASFEAAWLAHAVVDGLTPAHHEPYEAQLRDIKHTDTAKLQKVRGKMVMAGNSKREKIKNNWQYWGAKGIMTTHTLFEAGVATTAKPYRFGSGLPSEHDIEHLHDDGFEAVYIRLVKEVAALDMYEKFKKLGWTSELARVSNKELLPRIIMAVTLVWYHAYMNAQKQERK